MKWIWDLLMGRCPNWSDGDQAYYDGKAEGSNPHPPGSTAFEQWRKGFYGR